MKNKLVIILAVIAVVIVGAVFFFRQSAHPPSAGNASPAVTAPASPGVAPTASITQTQSSTATFDTNDNLDQALQDLGNAQ